MILAMGFSFYEIVNRIERSSAGTLLEMAALERAAADEDLEFQRVRLTGGNSLNLTIKNTGDILTELEWIGVFDDTSNTQDYYRVSESLNPTENQNDIGNSTIVMNPLNEYTIQVLTLGYGAFLATTLLLSYMPSMVSSAYIIAAVFGLYMGIVETIQRALIPGYVESGLKGTAYGMYYLVVGISFFIANTVVGRLWATQGLAASTMYSGALALIAILGMVLFTRGSD
jgi:hypothetical protein